MDSSLGGMTSIRVRVWGCRITHSGLPGGCGAGAPGGGQAEKCEVESSGCHRCCRKTVERRKDDPAWSFSPFFSPFLLSISSFSLLFLSSFSIRLAGLISSLFSLLFSLPTAAFTLPPPAAAIHLARISPHVIPVLLRFHAFNSFPLLSFPSSDSLLAASCCIRAIPPWPSHNDVHILMVSIPFLRNTKVTIRSITLSLPY